MARQTVPWDQWIVVDDCLPRTRTTLGQERVEPEPVWKPGDITLGRNMLAGLERVTGDVIAVIEDDEWYDPHYLETMVRATEKAALVGEGMVRYYNVRTRTYLQQTNARHASLSSSVWRCELTPKITEVIRAKDEPWYDLQIWRAIPDFLLFMSRQLMVGIKGMPGRSGIGIGHKGGCTQPDPDLVKLREWIGDDCEAYAPYRN